MNDNAAINSDSHAPSAFSSCCGDRLWSNVRCRPELDPGSSSNPPLAKKIVYVGSPPIPVKEGSTLLRYAGEARDQNLRATAVAEHSGNSVEWGLSARDCPQKALLYESTPSWTNRSTR